MSFYSSLGKIPHKRHTVFKKEDGGYYYEQLFGTEGFSSLSSLLYHTQRPTQIKEVLRTYSVEPRIAVKNNIKSQRLKGFQVPPKDDYLQSRTAVLVNNDCHIELDAPKKSMTDYFYKNSEADEMIFVHKGTGTLRTMMGNLKFGYGDYLIVPKHCIFYV